MKLHTKTLLTALTATAMLAGSADAASVLFVDNETPDGSWQTLIEQRNTYTLFDTSTYNLSLNNQASIDYVNSFDVIVMSGSNPNFGAVRNNGQTWHAQPTPILSIAAYLASGQFTNNSHGFFASAGTATGNPGSSPDVSDGSDLIWFGVPLSNGDTTAPDLYSVNPRLARQGGALKPGVTSVATPSGSSDHIILYAAPGSIAPGGAAAYYIAGMSGSSGEANPYTAEGEQVFLNAISILSGELVIPEPSSLALLSLGGLLIARRRRG